MSINGIGGFSASSIATRIASRADRDSSGGVSLDAFKSLGSDGEDGNSVLASKAEQLFSSYDSDSSGTLTETEIANGITAFAEEMRQSVLALQEASGMAFGGMGGPGGPGGGPGGPPPRLSEDFGDYDADSSGGLSLEEFTAAGEANGMPTDAAKTEEIFSAIDGDGDGALSEDELSAFEDAMDAEMQAMGPPPPPPPGGGTGGGMGGSEGGFDLASLLAGTRSYQESQSATDLSSLFSTAA